MINLSLLTTFLNNLKSKFVRKVNGLSPDADGNVEIAGLSAKIIPSNSDLNTYTSSGTYFRPSTSTGITNSPTTEEFFLTIKDTEELGYISQEILEYNAENPKLYVRAEDTSQSSGGTVVFSEWKSISADPDMLTKTLHGDWKPNEEVGVNYIRWIPGRENAGLFIYYTKAGTTGAALPSDLPDPVNADLILSTVSAEELSQVIPILKRNTQYTLGDLAVTPGLPSWAYLECTTPGTTATLSPNYTNLEEGDTITDGTSIFTVRRLGTGSQGNWQAGETVSAGQVRTFYGRENTGYFIEYLSNGVTGTTQPEIPETSAVADYTAVDRVGKMRMIFNLADKDVDEILALGVTYNRATYTELWNYVQSKPALLITETEWQEKFTATGGRYVPYYSSGDGTTTFRTPMLGAYPSGVTSTDDIGTYTSTLDSASGTSITMNGIWVIKAIGVVIDSIGNTDLNSILTSLQQLQTQITTLQSQLTSLQNQSN